MAAKGGDANASNANEFAVEISPEEREERRRIRQKYRVLIDDLQQNQQDLINPDSDELQGKLAEANEIFKPVKNPREAKLDSQVVSLIANMGRMKAQNLHTEFRRFQPTEFAEKVITFLGGQGQTGARISARGWTDLGRAAQPFFKRSPPFQFMLGSFERGPKPVKEPCAKKTREKDVVGKESVPTQMKDFDDKDACEATTEEVERVYDILKKTYAAEEGNPLCYFEFVLNPHSFGQTVENIFYVSFLIRDGLAQIFLDDDRLPVIKPIEETETSTQRRQERKQTVITISPPEWRQLIDVFKIESPTIPPRSAHSQANRSGTKNPRMSHSQENGSGARNSRVDGGVSVIYRRDSNDNYDGS